jgi:hypothetical protein
VGSELNETHQLLVYADVNLLGDNINMREEHSLGVFENEVLRRLFGPKREEDGSWRKLHNDELHSMYS